MPVLSVSADVVEGKPAKEAGMYQLQLVGFKPKYSKKGDSVNLNPQMKIVNHPTYNGEHVFDTLNTLFGDTCAQFFACFGLPLTKNASGGYDYPIDFSDVRNPDIEKATVTCPIIGQIGSVLLKVVEDKDFSTGKVRTTPEGVAKTKNEIQQYLARS